VRLQPGATAVQKFFGSFFQKRTLCFLSVLLRSYEEMMKRSAFMVVFLLVLAGPAAAVTVFDGVAAGDMVPGSAILWTRAVDEGKPVRLTAEVSPDAGFGSGVVRFAGVTDPGRDFTLKLEATGLTAGTAYFFRFTDGSTVSRTGRFVMPPPAEAAVPVRLAFSGDADGRWRPYVAVNGFGSTAPGSQGLDYYVFLGDTIYETASTGSAATPDVATDGANAAEVVAAYRRKYLENRMGVTAAGAPGPQGQLGLQDMLAATGSYTLLDNHELGNRQLQAGGAPLATKHTGNPAGMDANDTGGFINKTAGFRALVQPYLEYHPLREAVVVAAGDARTEGTTRLYNAVRWGRHVVQINLDDRSYRDIRLKDPEKGSDVTGINADGSRAAGARADNPARTMLGATQLAWFKAELLAAQAAGVTWKIVAISSPIDSVGSAQDGKSWYGGYRAERNEILKFIAENRISGVVFLSTDDHQMRTTRLAYEPDPAGRPGQRALVPGAFLVVTGPIGAGGPDEISDHSFRNIEAVLEKPNRFMPTTPDLRAHGDPEIGLVGFPGLGDVMRAGDGGAAANPRPVDFYAPDLFGYTVLEVDAGGMLRVSTYGLESYAANRFVQPGAVPGLVMRFEVRPAGL